MAYIDETIRQTINTFPLWDTEIWDPLQIGDYATATANLALLLSAELKPEEWAYVYWGGIINGVPAVRGEKIDQATWKNSVLPLVGRAIIEAASPEALAAAYLLVGAGDILNFHLMIVSGVPGDTPQKKSEWLKSKKPALFNFYSANAAGLGLDGEKRGILTNLWLARYQTVPPLLREMIFSARVAEIIRNVAEINHFPPEKIKSVSESVGLVILGLSHAADLGKEISGKTAVNRQASEIIADELNKRIFGPISGDLEKIYAPPSVGEMAMPPAPPVPMPMSEPKKLDAIALAPTMPGEKPTGATTFGALGPKPPIISPVSPHVIFGSKTPAPAAPLPAPGAGESKQPFILEKQGGAPPVIKQSPGFRLDLGKSAFGTAPAQGPKGVDVSRIFSRPAQVEGIIPRPQPQTRAPAPNIKQEGVPVPTLAPFVKPTPKFVSEPPMPKIPTPPQKPSAPQVWAPPPKSFAPPPPAAKLPTGPTTNIPPKNPLDLIKKMASEKELPAGPKEKDLPPGKPTTPNKPN